MHTLDSSFETIELRLSQETGLEPNLDETHSVEPNLSSTDERLKQATDPILRRVEELCALLASRSKMESTGSSEVSSWGRNRESYSPSRNR